MSACEGWASCPRCSGCGPDCPDCVHERARRPECWRCGGLGKVPCEITHEPDELGGIHATKVATDGTVCDFCDKPTPPGDGGCPDCWEPIPDNLADLKALFAHSDLSIEKGKQ